MIRPQKLNKGDLVATISLSGGSAGNEKMRWRYRLSKKRLEEDFGLQVISTKNSMKGNEYIYRNPRARAGDLMEAFINPNIKAIFLNLGGDDAIRILPFIDFDSIANNPKIFLGLSDATIIHFICYKAGLTSFYGPNFLTTLSEPVKLHSYTSRWLRKVLFEEVEIGNVEASEFWTSEKINWELSESDTPQRKLNKNNGYELLQGSGKVRGHLIGGCIEPLTLMIKGTDIFPSEDKWEKSIIFLEAVSLMTSPQMLLQMLRGLAMAGVFAKARGVIFGKPIDHLYYEDYKKSLLRVIHDEEGLDIPHLPLHCHMGQWQVLIVRNEVFLSLMLV